MLKKKRRKSGNAIGEIFTKIKNAIQQDISQIANGKKIFMASLPFRNFLFLTTVLYNPLTSNFLIL